MKNFLKINRALVAKKKLLSLVLAAMLCLPMMSAIKVHTIGDSTMAEYDPNTTDKRGWGMYLGSFFDTEVTVNNRGKSGADSRGFYTGAAYWPSVKNQMSAGDYLLIQFAHNDEGTVTYGLDNLEYAAYCAENGLDAPTDARGTNPQTTFRDYLCLFIDEARALNVTPVLVAPICRAYFSGNDIRRNGQHDLGDKFWKLENGTLLKDQSLPAGDSTMSYVHAMREVAKEKNVVFIDLTEETRVLYLSYGETECLKQLFCEGDKTHTNALGGNLVARAAAQLLKNAGVLADHITIPTDITANPTSIEIGEVYCDVAQNKEFLLTGYGLEPAAGNVALSTTANLQISLDKTTYAATANAAYSGGSMFQKVYVRALYKEGGEQKDTVFATAGEKVIAIPVHAEAISLVGGADISATWAIAAKNSVTDVVIEGPISAALTMNNMCAWDTKAEFEDGAVKTIEMVRFHNADANGSKTNWPAGEEDENAERYIDFAITAPSTMDLRISGISLDIASHSTSSMCYHINTGFGNGFTQVNTIAEHVNMTNKAIEHLNLNTNLTVKAGKTLHVRVLPWHNLVTGSGKYICLKNVKIEGKAFEAEPRSFTNFKVEFRDNPYTVLLPESGELPAGVTIEGTSYNGQQHGIQGGTITVPVDGPVQFTIGACQYSKSVIAVKKNGADFATIDNNAPCGEKKPNYNQFVTWNYNVEEAATLTFSIPNNVYIPYFFAEACDFVPEVEVKYFDTDGKTLIGKELVEGGSALKYKYGADDVTVAAGKAFRGWFNSASPTATKVPEGTPLNKELALYAHATDIEVATVGSIFDYNLTQAYFYPEDHEVLTFNGGSYHGAQHGWVFGNGQSVSVDVAGNALLVVGVCTYSNTGTTEVKDAAGKVVGQLEIERNVTGDGSEQTIRYEGAATTLTMAFTTTNYIHSIKVFNVENLPKKNEKTGFYEISGGDAAALILALQTVDSGDKIFLPNGVYDLGERVLTQISKNNIAIIGQSMEKTIIKNAPDASTESIDKTATIKIAKNVQNTYLQDLTIQNALDYYKNDNGRAVCLWDQGTKTICKNVRLLSYQDTYYSNLQGAVKYFEDCEIHGTVDFICGDGSVYFKNNLLYCEKRYKAGGGSDALTANNGPATDRGYVFDSCTVMSECPVVSLGRAWNNTPSVAFLNTIVDYSAGEFAFADSKNSIQRWTKQLMNQGAWPKFGEYNTHKTDGTVLNPTSNQVTFIDKAPSTETRDIETILSAEQAATYTMGYTLGEWATTAANDARQEDCDMLNIEAEGIYLVEVPNGNAILYTGAELKDEVFPDDSEVTARKANARGGFGKPVNVHDEPSGVESVQSSEISIQKIIRDGQLLIVKDGKIFNAQGTVVK